MWSNWAENAKSSMTQALERTGGAISKAATQAGKQARDSSKMGQPQPTIAVIPGTAPPPDEGTAEGTTGERRSSETQQPAKSPVAKPSDLLASISDGWNSVVSTTRVSVQKAEEKLKEQMSRARTAFYKRDPSLPLDVKALKDAEVVYVTDRLITLGHPAMSSQVNPEISGERKLAAVGHLLNRRHAGRYMVWNLSEVNYDVSILDDQVLTYSFPGSPSPPLGLLLKLLVAMESWLKADSRNVAVVHCLTGKGRTSLVLAAFLCWTGEAQFSDIYGALDYIAKAKQVDSDDLTIPSQRRYASYFKNMLDGIRPSQPPLMLRRIIMSEAPKFARGFSRGEGQREDDEQLMGCVPYIQIFKAGELLHTAPASLHAQQAANELPFCHISDGNISFTVDLMIQGDILVRARHLTASKKRVSMFRIAFHTGYAPSNVMRLTKAQLDGACDDSRFSDSFFIDLLFEPADAEAASKMLKEEELKNDVSKNKKPVCDNDERKDHAVRASADDTMLHRDSRFWNVIASRMKENAAEQKGETMCREGPTVGRRRDFLFPQVEGDQKSNEHRDETPVTEAFSIGGEFDFLAEPEKSDIGSPPIKHELKNEVVMKDSLMEALMGAIDDSGNTIKDRESEVIVFDSDESVKTPIDQTEDKAKSSGDSKLNYDEQEIGRVDDFLSELDIEDDMNALLGMTGDAAISEEDLMNMEIDDPDLEDLESFLSPK